MTTESLEAFIRMVQVDPELFEKLTMARAAATVEVAAAAGFDFTLDEARAAIDETASELNDERLEAVAAGLLRTPFPITRRPSE